MAKNIIGYKYYMDLHMGLCRGPVDQLVQVNVGDREAWPVPYRESDVSGGGAVDPVEDNSTVFISAAEIFGGDKKEGGILGDLYVLMGAATQTLPAFVRSAIGGLLPAFRVITTVFFHGLLCVNNPYPKSWSFRVRRWSKGWETMFAGIPRSRLSR